MQIAGFFIDDLELEVFYMSRKLKYLCMPVLSESKFYNFVYSVCLKFYLLVSAYIF